MNRRPPGLNLCEAIEGFTKYKVVEGLSERTLDSYMGHLAKLVERLGDVQLLDVAIEDIEDFFYWLRVEYQPYRISGRSDPLSNKSIYNIWVTLKSFFTWAKKRRFVEHNPMVAIPRPKFQEKPVEPFNRQDIERLLWACKHSLVAKTKGRQPFKMQRPTFQRDKALTMFLLDTGLRASDLITRRAPVPDK